MSCLALDITDLILDTRHLDMMTTGDTAFRSEVAKMFLSMLEESCPILTGSGTEMLVWGREAHRIKGAALNIGAHRLAKVCLTMEHCQDFNERLELAADYIREVDALRGVLSRMNSA